MLGYTFRAELRAKEVSTGLSLLVVGVNWTEDDPGHGLGPLPSGLSQAQIDAIDQVVAAHIYVAPVPPPDGPGFTMAMITALGNDPVMEIDVAQAYPPFFEYIRFANWPRVQWCITDALSKTKITQVQYDAIKAAAAAHNIPVML